MEKLYSSTIRVYLMFGLLLVIGVFCYFKIPVALFPNSTKPEVGIQVPYGKMTRDTFLNTYGKNLEAELKALQKKDCSTEETKALYYNNQVNYSVFFHWGDDSDTCIKEVSQILANYKSRWPEDVQKSTGIYTNGASGFLFITFHSEKYNSEQVYEILEPVLIPKLRAIHEANNPNLDNPNQTQITIELSPYKMASFKLVPATIFAKIRDRLQPFNAGTLKQNNNNITIEMSSDIKTVEDLSKIIVAIEPKKNVYLSEIAEIKIEPNSQNRMILRTDGAAAVALFISALPGKNIKTMSEKVIATIKETLNSPGIPKDIQFSTLVNPGEFIDHAVTNIMKEVWLCSLIAVIILFIFIGSFVGTLTALIEIPTSLILSFIIMKLTNVQLNLVSLGGLALSVGMNVDASIVVIDSIIRKFASNQNHNLSKTNIVKQVSEAVREVASPVIVSTITSLIVFIPLIFTSDLSYAILGDLAKTVVYSHGLSLFIAMILVPTIRIHLAQITGSFAEKHSISWLDKGLNHLYDAYCVSLAFFLSKKKLKRLSYLLIIVATILITLFIPPHLKREIIAKPESPIILANISASSNVYISQMEDVVAKFERNLSEKIDKNLIDTTFANIYSLNNAMIGIHLKDKKNFSSVLKTLQEMTKDDTDARYNYFPFNPAELPIPNPPDWKIAFSGNDITQVQTVKDALRRSLLEEGIVQDLQEDDRRIFDNRLLIQLHEEKLDPLSSGVSVLRPTDLAEIVTLASTPIQLGDLSINQKLKSIFAKYPDQLLSSIEDIAALPVPFGERIVPLRALADFKRSKEAMELQRVNGENVFSLEGYFLENEKADEKKITKKLADFIRKFREQELDSIAKGVNVEQVDAKVELSKALKELFLTIAISISLIFLVLLIQFSSLVHSLIILLAIPFGILGVFISLYVFDSTLSLNSGLGIILLVGITVANSIMLVEMIMRLVEEGISIQDAIMETARKRIRPIFMTSLITILGMLPVAIGYGDGGKVLQPLGIAVCGGLWVSLIFTLFIVPALELAYLNFLQKKS